MRIGTMFSSRGHGGAGMALVGLAVLAAACASRGGAPTPLTGAEAEAFFAGLNGVWELDESVLRARPSFKSRMTRRKSSILST